MSKTLFCIVGESACGKDTLTNKLIEEFPNLLRAVCSYTTRPKRTNEENGKDHYFISQEEFHKLKKELEDKHELVAYTKITSSDNPDGYEYMASLEELQMSNLYIIDPNGLKSLKENFPDIMAKTVIIYITAHLDNRISRAKERSDFHTEFRKRVLNEYEQFLDFNINKEYDYVIHNDNGNITQSYKELIDIMLGSNK